MFSPMGGPREEKEEVDWIGDLKFFIDNNNDLLTKELMPAVVQHKNNIGDPKSFKIYIKPLSRCAQNYCEKFEIDQPQDIFPKEALIKLAKVIAADQEKIIRRGDYDL